jgi:hypothetical protein
MKASELRIGNWISTIYGMEFQVYPIAFKQMPTDEKHNLILDTWKPIPLTEEWLFKFGFEIGYNQKKMLNVYCKDFGFLIERSNSNNFYYKKVNIHSIHQLQNLYFALTGIELTFKSK